AAHGRLPGGRPGARRCGRSGTRWRVSRGGRQGRSSHPMPAPPSPREVIFGGRGHAAIRGTHAKTMELVVAPDISARATCVVGVAVEAGPEQLAGFVGPVSIRLRVGRHEDVLSAVANPPLQPGARLVVRRSGYRLGDTFAVHADRGAAGLDRALLAALASPDARLEVTVRQ